jgi:CMP-N-acetylneuraminic acid synthetase
MDNICLISFAKKNSVRFPGKNYINLLNKPLIQYTFDTMKYIINNSEKKIKSFLITSCENCKKIAEKNNISVIFQDESLDTGDIGLNQRAHNIINSDFYILLQPTNPIRNNAKILEWVNFCTKKKVKTAYSVYKKEMNFIENGNFYYYDYSQLSQNCIKDNNSLLFIDDYYFDIDTKEDLIKTERFLNENKDYCGTMLQS